jgi:hypothetical protein
MGTERMQGLGGIYGKAVVEGSGGRGERVFR